MIITQITGGTGNQLFQYAAGRRLAYKLGTELKLDNTLRDLPFFVPYGLDQFNITAKIATHEEIETIKKVSEEAGLGIEKNISSWQEVLNYPDNVYLQGYWGSERYFSDIADVIRKDLTLKNPLSPKAEEWKQKILSAECSVSMHFRHGDFIYNPHYKGRRPWADIPPFEIYVNCLNTLKKGYKNITVFVFSNNLPFIKENLHLDVPIEFVKDCRHDVEELYLMSLCKHNIIPLSTFSWWAAWLNQNPDKKVFRLRPADADKVKKYQYSLAIPNANSPLDSDKFIIVPFDKNKCMENIKMSPIFSLLLVVNNDVATIAETLNSLLAQDYKYYEIIIIDNDSTDGSGKICWQIIKDRENVTYKRLRKKVTNAVAWNRAFKMAQGKYVSFLESGDRFLSYAFTKLYYIVARRLYNILHLFSWLEEEENGTITVGDKKYSEKRDAFFQKQTKLAIMSGNGQEVAKLLNDQQINRFLGTKIFYRDFLLEKGIRFDENLPDDEAELFFQVECFFKSKYFMHVADALYIAPRK